MELIMNKKRFAHTYLQRELFVVVVAVGLLAIMSLIYFLQVKIIQFCLKIQTYGIK